MTVTQTQPPHRSGWRRLSYPVPGSDRPVDMPFVILVVAALSGHGQTELPRLNERRLRHLEADNFDAVMQAAGPTLKLALPCVLHGEADGAMISVNLTFKSMDAFLPEAIAWQVPELAELMVLRQALAPLVVRLEIYPEMAGKLLAAADAGNGVDDTANAALHGYLRGLGAAQRGQLQASMASKMADIDARVSTQLDRIYHHPEFQRLEATWRGLAYLTRELESSELLQLRVFNAAADELARDFKRVFHVDRSSLFKLGVEEPASTFGDMPISLFVCDIALDNSPPSNDLAKQLAAVAAASSAPCLLGMAPALFGLADWSELRRPRELAKIFDTGEYDGWRALRAAPDARYLAVVGPGLLARVPWNTADAVAEHGISYRESCSQITDYLWMNGVFGMAALMANAFVRDGWCADLRGPIWGRIDGLPAHHVLVDDQSAEVVGPVAVDLPYKRHDELHKLGIASIARHARGDFAAMPAPRVFGTAGADGPRSMANSAAGIENQLEQVLCRCRVAQAINCFVRDHMGVWLDLEQAAQAVQAWLLDYCAVDPGDKPQQSPAGPSAPLVSARVLPAENRQGLDVELLLNYLPGRDVVRSLLLAGLPVERLSSRIIP